MTKPICEKCDPGNPPDRIQQFESSTMLLGFIPYWDKDGLFHRHDPEYCHRLFQVLQRPRMEREAAESLPELRLWHARTTKAPTRGLRLCLMGI